VEEMNSVGGGYIFQIIILGYKLANLGLVTSTTICGTLENLYPLHPRL